MPLLKATLTHALCSPDRRLGICCLASANVALAASPVCLCCSHAGQKFDPCLSVSCVAAIMHVQLTQCLHYFQAWNSGSAVAMYSCRWFQADTAICSVSPVCLFCCSCSSACFQLSNLNTLLLHLQYWSGSRSKANWDFPLLLAAHGAGVQLTIGHCQAALHMLQKPRLACSPTLQCKAVSPMAGFQTPCCGDC